MIYPSRIQYRKNSPFEALDETPSRLLKIWRMKNKFREAYRSSKLFWNDSWLQLFKVIGEFTIRFADKLHRYFITQYINQYWASFRSVNLTSERGGNYTYNDNFLQEVSSFSGLKSPNLNGISILNYL